MLGKKKTKIIIAQKYFFYAFCFIGTVYHFRLKNFIINYPNTLFYISVFVLTIIISYYSIKQNPYESALEIFFSFIKSIFFSSVSFLLFDLALFHKSSKAEVEYEVVKIVEVKKYKNEENLDGVYYEFDFSIRYYSFNYLDSIDTKKLKDNWTNTNLILRVQKSFFQTHIIKEIMIEEN